MLYATVESAPLLQLRTGHPHITLVFNGSLQIHTNLKNNDVLYYLVWKDPAASLGP